MKRHTTILILLLVATLFACSYENTATVTIDTGIHKQAQLNWFDRLLAFLSLSQPLQADPVPGQLSQDIQSIIVTVTAPDMETIPGDIPLDTGKITLEVPAGSQRTFEVVAFDYENYRYYGGITTVDLSPGKVNLNIEMGKLTYIKPYWDDDYKRVEISYNPMYYPKPIYFKVYQNVGNTAPSYTVKVESLDYVTDEDGSLIYHYTNKSISSDNIYDFYISAVSKYGEGEKYPIQEN